MYKEADKLRRTLATFKKTGELISSEVDSLQVWLKMDIVYNSVRIALTRVEGFSEYGFPGGHAASFAFLVYASAWIKFHYPAIFACSILNSQPMGFYAPSQIIKDALEHNVCVLEPCINSSFWDNTVSKNQTTGKFDLQLGFRQIVRFSKKYSDIITSTRKNKYNNINEVSELKPIPLYALNQLAKANCFRSFNLSRREATWKLKVLRRSQLPLFSEVS